MAEGNGNASDSMRSKFHISKDIRHKPRPPPPAPLADFKSGRPVFMTGFLGGMLNMTAGYMNAVCLVSFGSVATHASGTSTKAAVALVDDHIRDFTRHALVLFLFCTGACCSSLMIGGRRKFLGGKHYSPVLALIGFVVLVAALIGGLAQTESHERTSVLVCSLVSFAAGAQNAMTTYFSGAIVRTTHVTGTLTDIGIEIAGLILRKRWKDTWKLEVLICFFFGFFFGGVLGTVAALHFTDWALVVPASIYMTMSIGNFLYHHCGSSRVEVEGHSAQTPPFDHDDHEFFDDASPTRTPAVALKPNEVHAIHSSGDAGAGSFHEVIP